MNEFLAKIITFFFFATSGTIGVLYLLLRDKTKSNRRYENSFVHLKKSFNDLDEQAKLIVKTDLELNKAQEELDKRLNGLEALQKISRQISTTLDEDEIIHRLDLSIRSNLDYEKSLFVIINKEQKMEARISIDIADDDTFTILNALEQNINLIENLRAGHTFSSAKSPKQRKDAIMQIFSVEQFVLAPILTQSGMIGLVFVGNHSNVFTITEGDEEVIDILATQIGQAIENGRLFEQVFLSSKNLETKVQDRTSQLEKALVEVQNISKTKSDFISAVSHELRTPLTSIKGYAAILMDGKLGKIPEAVGQRLAKINLHSDNLVQLINDLLDISRIESGKVEMSFGKCQLKRMIEDVEDLLTPQMRDKDIQWKLDYDPKIPELYLDSSQVERVFINLVGNAIKFTPERGTISIKAEYDDTKHRVQAHVSDTGIGIPPNDVKRLFDEFFRVENEINQNVKGTGLGLPLAKKIVEAHDGTMWVTSVVGEGTTFHFTLPVKTEKETRDERLQDKAKEDG